MGNYRLIQVDEGVDVTRLIIEQEMGADVEVFVPMGTSLYFEGYGAEPNRLICTGRQVLVLLNPDIQDRLMAGIVRVQAEKREGEVVCMDQISHTVIVDGDRTFVQPGAAIIYTSGYIDTLKKFENIEVGGRLEYFGLEKTPGDVGFNAFIILIADSDQQ